MPNKTKSINAINKIVGRYRLYHININLGLGTLPKTLLYWLSWMNAVICHFAPNIWLVKNKQSWIIKMQFKVEKKMFIAVTGKNGIETFLFE